MPLTAGTPTTAAAAPNANAGGVVYHFELGEAASGTARSAIPACADSLSRLSNLLKMAKQS